MARLNAARVATRFVQSKMFGDIPRLFDGFRKSLLQFEAEWALIEANGPSYVPSKWEESTLGSSWWWMASTARELVRWIIETRSIPPGKAKAAELLTRAFMAYDRPPRKTSVWWKKNGKYIPLLLEAEKWPAKAEAPVEGGPQELIQVGPFKMHNTLHLEGSKLASTVAVIEKSTAAIHRAGSKLSKVLYGDIRVVGRLKQPRKLAWYYMQDDDLYLRPHLKVGHGELHNLTHELGHRYWFKFMESEAKREWFKLYVRSGNKPVKVALPQIGEVIPVPIQGAKEPPTVVGFKTTYKGVMVELSSGGMIKADALYSAIKQQAVAATFPTPYAATSDTEFFAEAYAMYILGTLQPEHRTAFEEIVKP